MAYMDFEYILQERGFKRLTSKDDLSKSVRTYLYSHEGLEVIAHLHNDKHVHLIPQSLKHISSKEAIAYSKVCIEQNMKRFILYYEIETAANSSNLLLNHWTN